MTWVYMQLNVVESHATVLNQMGTLLSNHVARGYIAVRHFDLKGVFVSHKAPKKTLEVETSQCNVPPCYMIAQHRPCSVYIYMHIAARLSLCNHSSPPPFCSFTAGVLVPQGRAQSQVQDAVVLQPNHHCHSLFSSHFVLLRHCTVDELQTHSTL